MEKRAIEELRRKAMESKFPLEPRLDDEFLLRFLRVKDYNIRRALESLLKYYSRIKKYQHLLSCRPSEFAHGFDTGAVAMLKKLYKGQRVMVASADLWKPNDVTVRHLQGIGLYQAEYVSHEEKTQENGIVVIVDCAGITFNHVKKLSPMDLKDIINMLQDGLPLRMTEVHIVNSGLLIYPLIQIGTTFLKEKLRRRVWVHYSMGNVQNFIPSSVLPKRLGGEIEDSEAFDTTLVHTILNEDKEYEEFWNPSYKF